MNALNRFRSNIPFKLESLQQDAFKRVFVHIDQLGVKQGIDKMGLDRFIEQCARLAATSGVISGGGGIITMAVGIPFDLVNMITQQFRVSLGILYYHRGTYDVGFDEFMDFLTTALQVEAGVAVTKALLERGAERIMLRMGSKTAGRLIPIIGAIIGGTTNYIFIKRLSASLIRLQDRYQPVIVAHLD